MWLEGLKLALSLSNLGLVLLASVLGIVIGSLPGLGPVFGLALFLSMTFSMNVTEALVFLSALYGACVYGGAISAILINTPGTPGSIATCFDGFPMAKRGEGGRALGIATMSSFFGGVFGVLSLATIAPFLASLALKIGPAEFFMLALAGLSLVAVAAKGDTIRGLMMGCLGLIISFFGMDVITGTKRFTFNTLYLEDGINFVALVIGVFALAQALVMSNEPGFVAKASKAEGVLRGVLDVIKRPLVVLRSTIIGIVLGIMPGVGISTANFIAYLVEKNVSKKPEEFGEGAVEGLIAPEAANNATTSSTLIPAFALGIPGGSTAALFLAAIMIHGMVPGYSFFTKSGAFFPTIIWGMLLGQMAFLILGLAGANLFAKVNLIPNALLVPMVVMLSFLGSFSYRNQILDVLVMIVFGLIGYYLEKYKFPLACLVLGVVLGNIAESNFGRAMRISQGSPSIFFTRPISLVLFIIIAISLAYPYLKPYVKEKVLKKA